jgi:hypothetical protein
MQSSRLISLEPLGTEVFLPAVLLGWEIDYEAKRRVEALDITPHWFLHIMQQAGGRCMSYPDCAGALLRFEANKDRFIQDANPLIRGMRCMAEDPNLDALGREHPVLRNLVCTWGEPYSQPNLRSLDGFLAGFVRLPPLESGVEALVRFAQCDLNEYFAGWKTLGCQLRPEGERSGSAYRLNEQSVYYIDEGNRNDVTLEDVILVDNDLLDCLSDLGRSIGLLNPIRAFLLWENSD